MAVANFALLTFLGGRVAEHPYIGASQIASVFYFGYFLIIIPFLGLVEKIGTDLLLEETAAANKTKVNRPVLSVLPMHYQPFLLSERKGSSDASGSSEPRAIERAPLPKRKSPVFDAVSVIISDKNPMSKKEFDASQYTAAYIRVLSKYVSSNPFDRVSPLRTRRPVITGLVPGNVLLGRIPTTGYWPSDCYKRVFLKKTTDSGAAQKKDIATNENVVVKKKQKEKTILVPKKV